MDEDGHLQIIPSCCMTIKVEEKFLSFAARARRTLRRLELTGRTTEKTRNPALTRPQQRTVWFLRFRPLSFWGSLSSLHKALNQMTKLPLLKMVVWAPVWAPSRHTPKDNIQSQAQRLQSMHPRVAILALAESTTPVQDWHVQAHRGRVSRECLIIFRSISWLRQTVVSSVKSIRCTWLNQLPRNGTHTHALNPAFQTHPHHFFSHVLKSRTRHGYDTCNARLPNPCEFLLCCTCCNAPSNIPIGRLGAQLRLSGK